MTFLFAPCYNAADDVSRTAVCPFGYADWQIGRIGLSRYAHVVEGEHATTSS
jgi:hypothetical protein